MNRVTGRPPRRPAARPAALALISLFASACAHTRYQHDSACQDISGIVGREWRVSFSSRITSFLARLNLGFYAGSTFPEISREYRETLIMGDHLCRAAAAGLVSPDLYERFLVAQLTGIHNLAIEAGTRSRDDVASGNAALAEEIRTAAPSRIRAALAQNLLDGTPAPQSRVSPFADARQVYAEAAPSLPPQQRSAETDAAYAELLARIEALAALVSQHASDADGTREPGEATPARERVSHSIFFDIGSDRLSDDVREEIRLLVERWGSARPYGVEGYADISGNRAANLRLSERRATAVAAMLRFYGASDVRLVMGSGATTAFGSDPRNRRVIIRSPAPIEP